MILEALFFAACLVMAFLSGEYRATCRADRKAEIEEARAKCMAEWVAGKWASYGQQTDGRGELDRLATDMAAGTTNPGAWVNVVDSGSSNQTYAADMDATYSGDGTPL